MTNQEIFNIVWNHFIVEEGHPSVGNDGLCMYKGPNGERCAAGLLIPDEKYKPEMEGKSCNEEPVLQALPFGASVSFIRELQLAHDDATLTGANFHKSIHTSLTRIARTHRLTIP